MLASASQVTPSAIPTIVAAAPVPGPIIDDKRAVFPAKEVVPSHPYSLGELLVIPRDSELPARCVKCANQPSDPWLKVTASWHPPGWYVLLISPIIYLIVQAFVRKRVGLTIPLCAAHKSMRKTRLWTGAVLLLLCIPVPVVFANVVQGNSAETIAVWMFIAMSIAGVMFLYRAQVLKPTRIGENYAEFKGACDDYLDLLPLGAPEIMAAGK